MTAPIPSLFLSSSKRKTSVCNLRTGTLKGIFFKETQYTNFSQYQKNMFNKIVLVDYSRILEAFPSVYSTISGGGQIGQFQAFCSAIAKILKKKIPELPISITTDSRVKLPKKYGGRGARAKRQKSYR